MKMFPSLILFVGLFHVSSSSCPMGWAEDDGWCYWISSYAYSFDLSRQVCRNFEGDLVVMNNVEQKSRIEKLIRGRGHDVWIGLIENTDTPGVYKWIDNSSPNPEDPTLRNWACGEPTVQCGDELLGPCGWYDVSLDPIAWKNTLCHVNKLSMCRRRADIVDKCDMAGGWHQYMGKCYKRVTDKRNWNDANNQCINDGGTLVILKDEQSINATRDLEYCIDYTTGVWIGLSDTDTVVEGDLQWEDEAGTPVQNGATNWGEGQPHFGNPHGSNCVASYAIDESKWWIMGCGASNTYMCERPHGTCAEGWLYYGTDYCYLVVTNNEQRLDWIKAEEACRVNYGGTLMKINTNKEQDSLKKIVNEQLIPAGIGQIRIGHSDKKTDNQFRWSDDTTIILDNWNQTLQETVPERMDCGYVPTSNNPNALWGTHYCFEKKSYICQLDLHKRVPTSALQNPQPTELTCPDGWKFYNNKCYKFPDQKKKYEEAKAFCVEQDSTASLLTILDANEQSFVTQNFRYASWLQLKYDGTAYVWEDTKQAPGFKNWGPGGKDAPQDNPCVRLQESPAGQWDNNACGDTNRGVICKMPAKEAISTTSPPGGTDPSATTPSTSAATAPGNPECDPGWSFDATSRKCFVLRTVTSVNWEEALRKCEEEEGADLASVTNPYEQAFLSTLMSVTVGGAVHYWIGLNDRDTEKGWQWTDGSPVAFFNWADGEPNNKDTDEWCVEMVPGKNGAWNDHACGASYDGYICKKIAKSDLSTTGPQTTVSTTPAPSCDSPERMVSGNMSVQDQDIVASRYQNDRPPWKARFNSGSGWSPTENTAYEYIEARFPFPRMVTKIRIGGAKDKDQWVKKFSVLHKLEEGERWTYVYNAGTSDIKVFDGNTNENKDNGVNRDLPEMIYAQAVRIEPKEWNNGISMRFDVLGCYWDGGMCNAWESVDGETKVIDAKLSGSGFKEGHEPRHLKYTKQGWEANEPFEADQWVQLEWDTPMRVLEIRTKGRKDENRYVKSYRMEIYNPYSPHADKWEKYQEPYGTVKIFSGNVNNADEVAHRLKAEVVALMIRIIPEEFNAGKAMRFEAKACPTGCSNILLVTGPTHDIPDSALKASSSYETNHGPERSRLNTVNENGYAGAWCAGVNDKDQWIEADLGYEVNVRGISIQGRHEHDQWVRKYYVKVSLNRKQWTHITWDGQNKTMFTSNYNRDVIRTNWFPDDFVARYVRIRPQEWNNHICMRFDVQGCPGPYSYRPVGCYADDTSDRDLPYAQLDAPSGGMTQEVCVYHCHTQGYLFAGVQFARECFCGNEYGSYGMSSQCNMECTGNHNEICGGYKANFILTTGLSPASKRCEDGWIEYKNKCYFFKTNIVTDWGDADYKCKQKDAELVSINNQNENDFVQSKLAELNKHAWIGLHCRSNSWVFEWSSYDEVIYTNWARREPNRAGSDEECVMINKDNGFWNDDPCSRNDRYGYVCKKDKEKLPAQTSPPPDPGCGEGWLPYRWKCYHILTQPNTWEDHKTNCEGWGDNTYLARIRDSQEQAFLASTTSDLGSNFWTDLNDRDSPGTYVFSNGASPEYTHWGSGQPDMRDQAACVSMSSEDNGLWHDSGCGETYGAICEKLSTTETQPPTENTPPASGNCPQDWAEYADYCYLVKSETENFRIPWAEAKTWCNNAGAELASIHSNEENKFLWKMHISNSGGGAHWIGLSRASVNESFKWTDGTEVAYVKWDENQPSKGTSNNCVILHNDSGKWRAVSCTESSRSFICKIKRGAVLSTLSTMIPPTPGPDGSCEPNGNNWKFYNEKCYFFRETKNGWDDAEFWCRQNGAHLASIHDQDTNNFIMGQVRDIGNSWVMWIGLNSLEGMEAWADGSVVEYTNWAPNQPDDAGGTKMCVGYGSNIENYGTWIHRQCQEKSFHICAKTKGANTITTQIPTPMPGGCPEGYIAYRDKCFYFSDEELTWNQARNKCFTQHKPYSLASISNRWEQAFITSMLLTKPHVYWIGLAFSEEGSQFYWTDNSQIDFTNWAPNEPNGKKNEPCVEMYHDTHKAGQWNDVACDNTQRYICMTYKSPEIPESPPLSTFCEQYGNHAQDYIAYDDDCYKAATGEFRTWHDAEAHCIGDEASYGHLVSIRNVYEQAFIESIFFDVRGDVNLDTLAWTGLTDQDQAGRYIWSDSRTVTYTNWATDEPNEPGGGCVMFQFSDAKWADVPCGETHHAICKISKKQPEYTRPPSGSCPGTEKDRDWLEYGSNCYMFFNEPSSFADANQECQLMGAELVSVHSDTENKFIQDHVQIPNYVQYWWLGLMRTPNGGHKWTDDSQVEFTNWKQGEPSDNGTHVENCVDMDSTNGQWNDITCDVVNGFICKIRIVGATSGTTPEPTFPTDNSLPTQVTPFTTASTQMPTQQPPLPTSNTDVPTAGSPGGSSSLGPGAIVGIVFAVLALILLALVVVLVVYRRNQLQKYAQQAGLVNPSYGTTTATPTVAEVGEDSTA